MPYIYPLTLLIAFLSNTILSFLISQRVERTVTTISFLLFLLCINIWGLPLIFINVLPLTSTLYEFLNRFAALGYIGFPIAFFVFAMSYTRRFYILRNFLLILLLLISGFTFLFLSWTTNLIDDHRFIAATYNGWGFASPPGPLFILFLIWLEFLMFLSMVLIIHFYFKTPDAIRKKQALILASAVLIPLVIGTITDGILPLFNLVVFPLAIPLTSIMAFLISLAIMKYGLFEVSPQTVLSNLADGIITVDHNGIVINSNKNALTILSRRSSLDNKSILEALPLQDESGNLIAPDLNPILIALNKRRPAKGDFYHKNQSRNRILLEVNATPVFLKDKIIGATISIKDITREKQLENIKDDFIAIASHELKNPIATIKGYSFLIDKYLNEEKNLPKVNYFVKQMDQKIDDLVKLVYTLLDLSSLQKGKIVLNKEKINFNSFIKDIAKKARQTNKSHKIFLHGKVNKNVYLDKVRFEEVITNLISNAIKYSKNAKKIIIKYYIEGQNLIVMVQDFGSGIEKSELSKIFEKYHRAMDKQDETITGYGLGLFIVMEIIKAHQGKIWVQSTPQKGSTFYVSIPIK